MDSQTRILLIAIVLITLVVIGFWLQPTIEERLAPTLERAWVAIEVDGSGIAEIGPVSVPAGVPFVLHAVLEARDRGGRLVYYTRAPALRFAGGLEGRGPEGSEDSGLSGSNVRPWDRLPHVKVRWFTIEGRKPFVQLEEGASLDETSLLEAVSFKTFLRPDWPLSWTIPGVVEAAHDDHLAASAGALELTERFGTQRYHVRIELYETEESVLPALRVSSWDDTDLLAQLDRFSSLTATLPGALAPASRVFGLTQLALPAGSGFDEATRQAIRSLTERQLAFTQLTVLGELIRESGARPSNLDWTSVELNGSVELTGHIAPGDLLRVGERMVVFYADRGVSGRLDYADLCFDFVRGAAIRRLDEVFSSEGEEDLVVEHAPLGR